MTNVDQDALEDLLRHASPRPVPSSDDEVAVRAAVRDEWRDLTGKRQSRRRVMQYAVAATVLLGVVAAFNVFRTSTVDVVRVASIEKSFGPVYLLGEEAELRPTDDLANVLSGQTMVTGNDAGLALGWNGGGSIRVDEKTRIRFTGRDSVFIEDGRVYFDSNSAVSAALTIQTQHGELRHLGTQYMTEVDADTLVVSVREGQVEIDGIYHDKTVFSGQQAVLAGAQQPSILSIGSTGPAWDWIGRTTPAADVDGMTLHEFLVWACREMGLELRFEGQAAAVAQSAILKGTIDTEPAEALRLRLATAALDWRIEGGVIYITDTR